VLSLLLIAEIVGCQMPPNNSATLDEAASRLKRFTDEMATKQELAAAQAANVAVYQQLTGRVDQLTAKVDRDIPARLDMLHGDLSDQRQRWTTIDAALVDDIGPRLRAVESSRRQYTDDKTIADPASQPPAPSPPRDAPSLGIVRIENRMTSWQHMEVNGFPYYVAPLRTVDVLVPTGKATTRLVDFEGTKTWWIDAPGYVQRVLISPRPTLNSLVRYP
jgi:hypothetical protein